jgi:hypothetical protein
MLYDNAGYIKKLADFGGEFNVDDRPVIPYDSYVIVSHLIAQTPRSESLG